MKYFWLSFTIHDPQKKFIAIKCVQKIIKNELSTNNSLRLSRPRYNLKLSRKLYPEIKKS